MKRTALLSGMAALALALTLPFFGPGGAALSADLGRAFTASGGTDTSSVTTATPVTTVTTIVGTASPVTSPDAVDRSKNLTAADSEHMSQKPAAAQPAASGAAGSAAGGGSGSAAAAGGAASSAAPAAAAPAPAPAAPACPANVGGGTAGAPSRASADGVAGTTSADLASFAAQYNAIRVANCLAPIAPSNIRYDSCLEDRLFWIAGDPSTDVAAAWGHAGTVSRTDGVPEYGCDGNLAGGTNNSGATVAQKWWDSTSHRGSLYKPGASTAGACIIFAMVHGGVNDPGNFTRASARWVGC